MAGASLNFDIFGRDQGVSEMFDKVGNKAQGLSGIFGAAGAGVAKLAGPIAAAFAVDQIGQFASASVDAFSELEDSTAAAGVVFGDSMSKIIEQSKTAAGTLGLSSQQVINAANTFGTYGKAAGLSGDDLAGFSTDLTGLAADMASFKGTSTEQAIEAVGAALRGEAEPIRAYGVMMDDASLKAEAMAQGIIKTTDEALTPQQKILAAQGLIFKQTADAQGDFARTSTSTANVAKTLASAQENLSAKTGTLLAPAFTMARRGALEMVEGISRAVDWMIPKSEAMYAGIDKAMSGIRASFAHVKDFFAAGWTLPKLEFSAIGKDIDPIIAVGFRARQVFNETIGPIRAFGAAFKAGDGDITSAGLAGKLEEVGYKARLGFNEGIGGVRAFGAAFKAGDGDITSAGFPGKMEALAFTARTAFNEGIGGVRAFGAAFKAGGDDVTSAGFAGKLELMGLKARAGFNIGAEAGGVFFDGLKTGSNGAEGGINGFAAQLGNGLNGIFQAVAPLLPQILQLWQQLSPVSIIFQALMPVLPQLVGLIGQLAVGVGGGLSQAITQLMPALQAVIASLVGAFGQILPVVLSAFASLLPIVIQAFMGLVPVILQIVAAVVPFVVSLLPPLLSLFAQLVPIVMQVIAAVLPLAVGILGVLLPALSGLVQIIAAVLIPIISALLPVVSVVFAAIASIIGGVLQVVTGIIQVFTGILTGNWAGVWAGILNIFSGIWQTIIAVLGGVLGVLGSIIGSGLGFVGGLVRGILGGIGGFFASTWGNIIGGVSGFIGQLLGFFSGLPGQIMGFLGGAGSWLYNAGRDIINGLIRGVQSMIGAIGNAILSLVPGPIVGVFKSALGIASPSKVFRGLGREIPNGIIAGVSDMVPAIEDRISTMVPASLQSLGPAGGSSSGGSGRAILGAAPALHIENITVHEAEQGGWRQMGNNILQAVQVQAPAVLA
jgi:hypothetical protein